MTSFQPTFEPNAQPASAAEREAILRDPVWGERFTDHMVLVDWTLDDGWHDARVVPYGPLPLSPASAVLHYSQEIFEGLKAYRHADGSICVFRPDQNAARFQRSAERLGLPEFPADWFIGAIDALVSIDSSWVPSGDEKALYLRPFMFASEPSLMVRVARAVTFVLIASPVGSYFHGDANTPPSVWVADGLTRAADGGTGAAKTGGNYAASLLPLEQAAQHGCEQAVFLDAREHRLIEELGGMNLFFVYRDGRLVTPKSSSILPGITKLSLFDVAADLGHVVSERPFALAEWIEGVGSGEITEVFACGTAAVIAPIGRLVYDGGNSSVASDTAVPGPITTALRAALVDIQYGRAADTHGWMRRVPV